MVEVSNTFSTAVIQFTLRRGDQLLLPAAKVRHTPYSNLPLAGRPTERTP